MEIELSSGAPADLYPTIGATRGLVVVTDLFGRRKLFDEMAAGLAAAQSWNVVVVDPFRGRFPRGHRSVPDQDEIGTREQRHAAVRELDDDEVVGDVVDAANRLEVEPVALTGFCLGGMYALKSAASHRFDRIVSFYGMIRIPERWQGTGQREPLRLIDHAAEPKDIMAIVGTEDSYTPAGDVDALEAKGVTVVRYEGAEHAFVHDPEASSHRPTEAADAWGRFHQHLTL